MTSLISHTTVDVLDAHAAAGSWSAVLGSADDPDDPNHPGDEECLIQSPDGAQRLLSIEVPEAEAVENRLHLDLEPVAGGRDDELARLLARGALQVEDRRRPDGSGWVVLADPEGNEFCLLRRRPERVPHPQT